MIFHAYGASDLGLVREQNEDSFLVDEPNGFFAVADGIGGMPGGEVASQTAIQALEAGFSVTPNPAPADLDRLVQQANQAVCVEGRRFGGYGIGTTLTLAYLTDGEARLAHIGDSFALLVHDGVCRPLTREHNVENDRGTLLDLAPYPPSQRYALTRSLGQSERLVVDVLTCPLAAGDWLILATDGLTDLVDPAHIAALATTEAEPSALVQALIAAALEGGGHDNITVVAIRID